jgi:hypothetical protein
MKSLTKEGIAEIKRRYEEKCRACYKRQDGETSSCSRCYLRLALEDLDIEKNAKTPINRYEYSTEYLLNCLRGKRTCR